ncbi:hypothetical protein KTD31_31795, partial [Burkholderia multivorans]|nr:hypothetical protein [Burkholderia multivorans]MDN7847062.1 hypothetical protein [Burkholderia multivorans]
MPRKKLIIASAATIGVLTIALGAFALTREPSGRAIASGAAATSPASGSAPGQHGGTVLTSGRVAAEIVLSEKPGDARIVVYPLVDGKPAQGDIAVSGALTRYDGLVKLKADGRTNRQCVGFLLIMGCRCPDRLRSSHTSCPDVAS